MSHHTKRSRAWVFTVNNPRIPLDYSTIDCEYIIVGDEKAPQTGTPHHQGYIRYKCQKAFSTVKKHLPDGSHIERAKGTPQDNVKYCSKEKIYYESGNRPKMGKRNDIKMVKDIVKNKGGMRDIIDATESVQALKYAQIVLKYFEQPRSEKPVVKWFHGDTGTGKTRQAFAESKDPWVSGRNLKWWEGYDAHKHVIIDDFRRDFCTFHELLRILDRYPYLIENKGGSRQLLATQIIITCPFKPEEIYDTREDIQQLLRRIDEVRQF